MLLSIDPRERCPTEVSSRTSLAIVNRHGEPFLTDRPIGESKPAGAYRPPGARGTLASDAYRRDDEASSGASTPTPMFKGGKPAQRYVPGHGIPGAGPPGSATPGGGKDGDKKKRVRSKRPLKDGAEGKESEANTPAEVAEQVAKVQIGEDAGAVDEAVAKKIRNLTKKVGDPTSSELGLYSRACCIVSSRHARS